MIEQEEKDLITRLGQAYRRVGKLEAALEVAVYYLTDGTPPIPPSVHEALSYIAIEEADRLK